MKIYLSYSGEFGALQRLKIDAKHRLARNNGSLVSLGVVKGVGKTMAKTHKNFILLNKHVLCNNSVQPCLFHDKLESKNSFVPYKGERVFCIYMRSITYFDSEAKFLRLRGCNVVFYDRGSLLAILLSPIYVFALCLLVIVAKAGLLLRNRYLLHYYHLYYLPLVQITPNYTICQHIRF